MKESRSIPVRLARLFAVLSLVGVGLVVVSGGGACVLIEPPGDLPRLPTTRPTIVRGSVVPSASSVLGTWPDEKDGFIVPVELADPKLPFEYAAFVDYNAFTGEGLQIEPTRSDFERSNTTGRIRTLNVVLPPPSELDRCHVVEVVVALRLESNTSPQTSHTPAEPSGDIVTWFYNPSGDLRGCPTVDAGIRPLDAGSEAGEGGVP